MGEDWAGIAMGAVRRGSSKKKIEDKIAPQKTGEVCTHTHSRVGRYYASSTDLGLVIVSRPGHASTKSGKPIVVVGFVVFSSTLPYP
jgi:hypothetical protein